MKILIIKLGALGDVLRTTPLLEGLKKIHPSASISWLVDERHRGVLERNPGIAALYTLFDETHTSWKSESYDWVINLDKEPEALDAMAQARGARKSGFCRDAQGRLAPADHDSDYAYRLGIDDELKFRLNQKSYQAISFEQCGLRFAGEAYAFFPSEKDLKRASEILGSLGLERGRPVIGVNTGSGARFAGKRLPDDSYLDLARELRDRSGAEVLLLGGDDEKARNAWIAGQAGAGVHHSGSHPIGVFAGLVSACDVIITGDTTAMHIAIAMKIPALVYFGSTCASEIELYGRGDKVVSHLDCAPCYKKICPIQEKCMSEIRPRELVLKASVLLEKHATRIP